MREIRIYAEAPESGSDEIVLRDQQARHVARVLRMKTGETLTVFDGVGNAYAATIQSISGDTVALRVGNTETTNRESPLAITLGMALVRGERMDLVIQKATELGVSEIVPLQCTRSVVQLGGKRAGKRQSHWQRVAISGCEQCGRNRLPLIRPVTSLDAWLQALEPTVDGELRIIADPDARHEFDPGMDSVTRLQLLIGPEGGLSEGEIMLAREQEFRPVRFGPRTLRAETAAISLVAIMQWQLGDLRAP